MTCAYRKEVASKDIEVDIHLTEEEVQKAYQGAEFVYARATDGRSIRFPVRILWSFIGHDGIHGRFLIQFSHDNKFESIYRLS